MEVNKKHRALKKEEFHILLKKYLNGDSTIQVITIKMEFLNSVIFKKLQLKLECQRNHLTIIFFR